MKKVILFYLAAVILGWSVMMAADLLQEYSGTEIPMFFAFFVLAPLMIVLYILMHRRFPGCYYPLGVKFADKLLWAFLWFTSSYPICQSVNYRRFFIKQDAGAMDGIEYFVFAFLYGLICLLGFMISDVVLYFVRKKKEKVSGEI